MTWARLSPEQKFAFRAYKRAWRANRTPEQKARAKEYDRKRRADPKHKLAESAANSKRWAESSPEHKQAKTEYDRARKSKLPQEKLDIMKKQNAKLNRKYREATWHTWLTGLVRCAVSRARKKDLPCTVTVDFLKSLLALQNERCFWTGIQLMHKVGNPWVASMDRLQPHLGYIPGNVVLCAWLVNRARNDMPFEDFREALQVLKSASFPAVAEQACQKTPIEA